MTLKSMFIVAPDNQLDASMQPLIAKWDDEPTAIQILEVLDQCIYAGLASGFTISILQTMLAHAQQRENLTLDDLVPLATWRDL